MLHALGIRHDFPAALMKAKPESWFVDEYKLGAGDTCARIRAEAVKRAVTGDDDVLILTLGDLFVITGGEGSDE